MSKNNLKHIMTIIENPEIIYNPEDIHPIEIDFAATHYNDFIQRYGLKCLFLPNEKITIDEIFGESKEQIYNAGIEVKFGQINEVVEDFYPEPGMYEKFGFTADINLASFIVTKEYLEYKNITPYEDDLIYYEKTKKLFSITKVTAMNVFLYQLDARLIQYNHDQIQDTNADLQTLNEIEDEEVEKIKEPIINQISVEEIIDENAPKDGLYGN